MLNRIFKGHAAKVSISMGLVGVVISLMMVAGLIGVFPDKSLIISQQRAMLAEALAINGSVFITLSDLNRLEVDLKLVVERNEEILSAAVVNSNGRSVVETGDHFAHWIPSDEADATGAQVEVPLVESGKTWGYLQLRFVPLKRAGLLGFFDDPVVHTTLFLSVTGFVAFFFYLGSMLKQLDPSQAIPGRVRSALDTMAEGLLVLDAKQNIVLANEAFATIVGMESGKILGKAITDFGWDSIGDQAFSNKDAPWSRALTEAQAMMNMRVRLRLDADSEPGVTSIKFATFMTNCSPVLAREGKAQGVLISFDDVSELEQKEIELQISKEEAEAANKSKSDFLANMSHEIRTPMNAILGFTEVLKRGNRSPEESNKHLNTISSSGTHLLNLINDILDLSKVEAGKIELELVEGEPRIMIHEILTVMRGKAEEKDIYLDFRPDGELPTRLKTDVSKVRQILINLVGNAIKFTEEGGVSIVTRYVESNNGPVLTVDVTDTGVGMTEGQASKIFESFVQADSSITRRFGGTGLGLSISKKFALALGGDIVITSEPGAGSTFSLHVPVQVEADVEMSSIDELLTFELVDNYQADGQWVFFNTKVLVVDDGEENRNLLELVLGEVGLDIVTAVDGKEAFEKSQSDTFDLILMDVQMAEMDGLTSVRLMREAGLEIPVIALTADAMVGVEQQCLNAGYSGYMTKPINLEKLLVLLGKELGGTFETATAPVAEALIEAPTLVDSVAAELPAIRTSLPMKSEKIRELVRRFVPRLNEQLESMQREIEAENGDEVFALAHWLKGSAGSVGFHDFTEPAAELEKFAKAGDTTAMAQQLADIRSLAERIVVDGETTVSDSSAQSVSPTQLDGSANSAAQFQSISAVESPQPQDMTPIHSTLPLGDEKMRMLVGQFIDRLKEQCGAMREAQGHQDYEKLAELGLWLKGLGGSVGFGDFTEVAEELEQGAKSAAEDVIERKISEIEALASRCQMPLNDGAKHAV